MKEVRGKLMALVKKHQIDITEFSETCGIKEEQEEIIETIHRSIR